MKFVTTMLVALGFGFAAAPAVSAPLPSTPTSLRVIGHIYPDLMKRELSRANPSWAHLRKMTASRWRATHPAAVRAERRKAARSRYQREADRYRSEFTCIGRYESGNDPTANTGNGYHGELQMDSSFEQTYGPELVATKGHAENWTRDEQYAVASRAVPSRGFTPWPNTGRMCGLI